MRAALAACFLLASAGDVRAQEPPATVTLQTPSGKVPLGKPFEIAGTAGFPDGSSLSIDLSAQTTAPVVLLDARLGSIKTAEGRGEQSLTLTVMVLELGSVTLSPLDWTLKDPSGKASLVKSPPVKLEVEAPAGTDGPGDIRDIKPPYRGPVWPLLLVVALAATAAAAAFELWRRRARDAGPGAPAAPQDTRAPHEIALAELESLRGAGLAAKEFYVRVSDILRLYLERRFGIPAMTLITHDLVRQMRQAELERALVTKAKDLFDRCDLVKFAKLAPPEAQRRSDLDTALEFVGGTRPVVDQAQPADAAPGA